MPLTIDQKDTTEDRLKTYFTEYGANVTLFDTKDFYDAFYGKYEEDLLTGDELKTEIPEWITDAMAFEAVLYPDKFYRTGV